MVDGHNGHKISKNHQWPISVTHLIFFEFFNFDPKYLKKVPLKNFCDYWLNQPSRGWRTRIWPKTGTGSSFRRHFVGKTNLWVFLGFFSARCLGPGRSVFGPISYFMESNIWRKFQGFSLNTTYLSHGRL